ncbi:MAG: hypothetical protein RL228_384 [Actinomycetota bacterium]
MSSDLDTVFVKKRFWTMKKITATLIGIALLHQLFAPIIFQAIERKGLFLERPESRSLAYKVKEALQEQMEILETGEMHYPFPFAENAQEWQRHAEMLVSKSPEFTSKNFHVKVSVLFYERMDTPLEPRLRIKLKRTYIDCRDWDLANRECGSESTVKGINFVTKEVGFWEVNGVWEIRTITNYQNYVYIGNENFLDWSCILPGDTFQEIYRECPILVGDGEPFEPTKWNY